MQIKGGDSPRCSYLSSLSAIKNLIGLTLLVVELGQGSKPLLADCGTPPFFSIWALVLDDCRPYLKCVTAAGSNMWRLSDLGLKGNPPSFPIKGALPSPLLTFPSFLYSLASLHWTSSHKEPNPKGKYTSTLTIALSVCQKGKSP